MEPARMTVADAPPELQAASAMLPRTAADPRRKVRRDGYVGRPFGADAGRDEPACDER